MFQYLIRRLLYALPILLGVNLITFALFFMVNSPDDIARMHLGKKHVTPSVIALWKTEHGYDKPLFFDPLSPGLKKITNTLFFRDTIALLLFDFGKADNGNNIKDAIKERMWPSLMIAVPTLILSLLLQVSLALVMILFRGTYVDKTGMIICVFMMSVSGLFYIMAGQFFFAESLRLFPISGYDSGLHAFKFILLPVMVSILAGMGSSVRWYRDIFLEELNRDYIRTARAKGLSELAVLFKHLLRNALLPITTSIVVIIPSLFMGSLILEAFFGIPGLGSYTIDAIQQQDFAIVRAMVFLGSLAYLAGLWLADITCVWVDPRIRLER